MQPVSKPEQRTGPDGSTVARSAIDATVADLAEEMDLDYRELADMLLETRDTLLVSGRVPEWFGDVDGDRYTEMVRG